MLFVKDHFRILWDLFCVKVQSLKCDQVGFSREAIFQHLICGRQGGFFFLFPLLSKPKIKSLSYKKYHKSCTILLLNVSNFSAFINRSCFEGEKRKKVKYMYFSTIIHYTIWYAKPLKFYVIKHKKTNVNIYSRL